MEERLETGWFGDSPDDDTILRAACLNAADRIERTTAAIGGRSSRSDRMIVADTDSPSIFGNPVLLFQPFGPGDVADVLAEIADGSTSGRPSMVMSPFPTPDLAGAGLLLFGHPPFMLRSPGPAPLGRPDGLVVREVTDPTGLAAVERTLIDGFPVGDLADATPGSLLGADLLGGPFRFYLGTVDDEPVATAAAMVGHGVVQVENVATLDQHRGQGFGEAVTWAATTSDPALPAVLIASDLGRPVYERMGYRAIFRWTLWGHGLGLAP